MRCGYFRGALSCRGEPSGSDEHIIRPSIQSVYIGLLCFTHPRVLGYFENYTHWTFMCACSVDVYVVCFVDIDRMIPDMGKNLTFCSKKENLPSR